MSNTSTVEQKKRVTLIGAGINLLLAVVKIVVGKMANSHALIADGIHSLSDLLTDLLVWFAAHYGSQAIDEDHPYVGAGIAWDAVARIHDTEIPLQPGVIALFAALFSILANEGLFHYTLRVAKETRSRLIEANAWHHRSDAISSVIVLIGVAGSLMGFESLDDFAAIMVAVMVAKIGYDLVKESLSELVDTSLPKERLDQIRSEIKAIDGVTSLHFLRTRRMGGEALVDVHIQVDPVISVSEGHLISDTVKYRLLDKFEEISDVLVHVDPEDDEETSLNANLPLRGDLEKRVHNFWSGLVTAKKIRKINLHYLKGKVIVEVILPLSVISKELPAEEVERQFKMIEQELEEINEVIVYFSK